MADFATRSVLPGFVELSFYNKAGTALVNLANVTAMEPMFDGDVWTHTRIYFNHSGAFIAVDATYDQIEEALAPPAGQQLQALREAEAFITGFEDDELQDVKPLLTQVRAAIKAGEA